MVRVAIADSSNLIYSDDYRDGWPWGFEAVGCEVQTHDAAILARLFSNRGPYSSRGWIQQGKALAQNIIKWNPDLVWVHHGRYAARDPHFIEMLRGHGIKTAVYLCDEPYECGETLKWSKKFDYVFSMDPCTIHLHKKQRRHGDVFYLPPAVNPERFRYTPWGKKNINALFLGNASLTPRPRFLKLIQERVPSVDIRFWTPVGKHHKEWVSLDEYPQLYARTKIGLNIHRDPSMDEKCFKTRVLAKRHQLPEGVALAGPPEEWGTGFWNEFNIPASHVNPRFFEMAASGCCVISDDYRSELRRLFPVAPRAQDPEHFLELVEWFLENGHQAEWIGRQCSDLISKRHTYAHRAAEILVRTGLQSLGEIARSTSLGEPEEWLNIQDWNEQGESVSLGPTGSSERYNPRSGSSRMPPCGIVRPDGSLDLRNPLSL